MSKIRQLRWGGGFSNKDTKGKGPVDSVNLRSVHWASVDDSSRGALPDRSLNGGNLGSTGASRLPDPLQYFSDYLLTLFHVLG